MNDSAIWPAEDLHAEDHPEFENHQELRWVADSATGLRAIIALHRYAPGMPAVGGIRFRPYSSADAALTDALRLSRAMTRKNVLAGLPVRGGKTVIVGDPTRDKDRDLLHALGRQIEALAGRYLGGPDVGTTPQDMDVIREVTDHVGGTTASMGVGGSAPPTAEGVFHAIRALAQHLNGRPGLAGVHVAIQGVGAVGADLAGRLAAEGARLTVADVHAEAVARVTEETGADEVSPNQILFTRCDIVAPCALGAVLDSKSIPQLRTRGVCGAANNQLATVQDAARMHARGITFVPDYLASAGGVIAGIGAEGLISSIEARQKVEAIFDRTLEVLERGAVQDSPATEVADEMVRDLLAAS